MFENKKIFILGMARSGYEVAKLLHEHGCDILITDMVEDLDKQNELENLGIKCVITKNQEELLDETYDYVIKNPGVPVDAPLVLKAYSLGIPVTNEVEVAYSFLPKNVKVIGITGSNGKTTTTSIIYDIFKEAGLKAHLGGNIGIPASRLIKDINEGDYLVIEISSHQLHDFKNFKTDVSILTNLVETHLEHFYTYDAYKNSKLKIFNNHNENNIAIINKRNEESLSLTKDIISNKMYFSSNSTADIYLKADAIYYKEEMIINTNDIKVKGVHNYENIMAAILVSKLYNIDNEVIRKVLGAFSGVEHRIEYVTNINNRVFYNDSKSTNIIATITALSSFKEPTILLLGGNDRNQNFKELLPHMNYVKSIVCYGEMKDKVETFAIENNFKVIKLETLKEATEKAYEESESGDIILLSPAAASWDQFKNFEERGKEFKNTIKSFK